MKCSTIFFTSVGKSSPINVHGMTSTPNELQHTYPSTHINRIVSPPVATVAAVCSTYIKIVAMSAQNVIPNPDESKNFRRPMCREKLSIEINWSKNCGKNPKVQSTYYAHNMAITNRKMPSKSIAPYSLI